ncbi:CinA family protein [Pseudonocardia sp. TRM90224]|uniref:CinA family protein n=1 Tax=Pseudonocardia sp. TRM90224 TaxID=2812678 RepID=UPI001E334562|nr:CinA family protein [Pseudonocardia sp. TRM90224]
MSDVDDRVDRVAGAVAERARSSGRTIAVAESLTGGLVASALARARDASTWFRGALVAYSSAVKHEVLGVPDGPVVSAEAAGAMASGVRRLLGADVAVAVTGAGGPDPQDGRRPGTVFIAVDDGTRPPRVTEMQLDGGPQEICAASTEQALTALAGWLTCADGAARVCDPL